MNACSNIGTFPAGLPREEKPNPVELCNFIGRQRVKISKNLQHAHTRKFSGKKEAMSAHATAANDPDFNMGRSLTGKT